MIASRLTSTAPTSSIDMSLRLMAVRMSTPRPPAPMVAAMVITPMFITTAVRTPARITGTAMGSSTMRRRWPKVMPMPRAASRMPGSTLVRAR